MKNVQKGLSTGIAALLLASGLSACSAESGGSVAANCTPEHSFTTVTKGVLTVAATDAPPLSSTADNSFTGVEATLLKKFAAANCLTVESLPTSFAAAIPTVESGRADIATGGFYRTAERAKIVTLSAPTYLDQLAAVSKTDVATIEEAIGQKVGTVDGYMWTADIRNTFGSNVTVYPSSVEMRADLKAGRIAVALDSSGLAGYLYSKDTDISINVLEPDGRVAATAQPAQMGFPSGKTNAALSEALNATIATWTENGTTVQALTDAGLSASMADVGPARLLK
ncbi:L-cystine-binding protein FliY [Arthrobacter sp. Bi83]|uniref:substrate-binding periplasmic protein n=1 Tax=Arthrobacter sp. Bi83 TaxID=2822353 RepID=UPI001DCE092D|nr:transporter substrate-binding domain-containing protein [Arthrobacter sp. Bi83]CAH0218176.1 L-cystine-binding protein FliY [Arthrobacter sp. Bi83]